ncbi:hypothetical protein [Methylobacterium platani]|uniref:Uncharacterized protein n=2 Tax=Methylobacterium platani TaxID=427683 RepID=A0A179SB15_9HYPH|nr:hypothetical protein [Methylobacterium platani]KMO12489.1 hypothetical protein SQ03_24110 [Methylobacterium platani JCM 14648]OAS24655.1 hypothetical protein A5481_13035 [Methylobacterium platani]
MMSIGAALSAATTRVGRPLPVGLAGARAVAPQNGEARDVAARDGEEAARFRPEDGALLVAIEAGLREAGYLDA